MANSKNSARQQPKGIWEYVTELWNENVGNNAQAGVVPMTAGYKQAVKQDLGNTFQLNQTPEERELERRKALEFSNSFK